MREHFVEGNKTRSTVPVESTLSQPPKLARASSVMWKSARPGKFRAQLEHGQAVRRTR